MSSLPDKRAKLWWLRQSRLFESNLPRPSEPDSEDQTILACSSTGMKLSPPSKRYCEFTQRAAAHFDFSTHQRGFSPSKRNDFEMVLTPRLRIARPLSPVKKYNMQEQTLHRVKVFLQSYVERAAFKTNLDLWDGELQTMESFRSKALEVVAAIRTGLSHASVDAAWSDTLSVLARIALSDRPYLLTLLLDLVVTIARKARETNNDAIHILNRELIDEVARLRVGTHPVVLTLQAIIRSSGIMNELSERLLLAGKDILAQSIGNEHFETREMLLAASRASEKCGHLHAALDSAKDAYRIDLSRHKATATDQNLEIMLDCQIRLVQCHVKLGNLVKAQELVENGLASCCHFITESGRDNNRSRLCFEQGIVKWMSGQLTAAEQSFAEALALSLPIHGAGDYFIMHVAEWLEFVLHEQKSIPTKSIPQTNVGGQQGISSFIDDETPFPAAGQEGHIVPGGTAVLDCEARAVFEETVMSTDSGEPGDFDARVVVNHRAATPETQMDEKPRGQDAFVTGASGVAETWYYLPEPLGRSIHEQPYIWI
ncbi:hypothetical protein H2200_004128 [Cladophialophora chaetospira]|uniref:Uncharacterized protein n=1 Tax=Cladophialophora chaetospira TaxID=386627 RepID=A0AA39CLQ2_9EURO|nr:hypothetical protein H2200_004128 [Cladophialophora chaetospira]